MRDSEDPDFTGGIINFIEDAIFTNPDSPGIRTPGQFLHARRARFPFQAEQSTIDALLNIAL